MATMGEPSSTTCRRPARSSFRAQDAHGGVDHAGRVGPEPCRGLEDLTATQSFHHALELVHRGRGVGLRFLGRTEQLGRPVGVARECAQRAAGQVGDLLHTHLERGQVVVELVGELGVDRIRRRLLAGAQEANLHVAHGALDVHQLDGRLEHLREALGAERLGDVARDLAPVDGVDGGVQVGIGRDDDADGLGAQLASPLAQLDT